MLKLGEKGAIPQRDNETYAIAPHIPCGLLTPELLRRVARLLEPGGVVVFSNNYQKFRLDPGLADGFDVRDVTRATLPEDFARNPRIHCCYELRIRGAE